MFDWTVFWASLAQYVIDRAKERSTYLGLIALAASLGVTLNPALAQVILIAASGISGAILVASHDAKTPAAPAETEMGAGTDAAQ